jgi:3-phosphoshikimate 1-carboxyvinyltransferase
MKRTLTPANAPLSGALQLPGDKSISHRALLLGTIAEGSLQVRNLAPGIDVGSTRSCLEAMGGEFQEARNSLHIRGRGLHGLSAPTAPLDCGNSGTTMRLLMGVLAGMPFSSELIGDDSLSARPMERVATPLREMGAQITLGENGRPPVRIAGGTLNGIDYTLPVASAQVKSAVLLAGLLAQGPSQVTDPFNTRNHTENMLAFLSAGAAVSVEETTARVLNEPLRAGKAKSLTVPGDPSSGAFFAAAAALLPQSQITLQRMLLNPTRLGFYEVLREMGGQVTLTERGINGREHVGDVDITYAPLHGITLAAERVPTLIDEIPLLALLAAGATGESRFMGLAELRVKESDRLAAILRLLTTLGGQAQVDGDTLIIQGNAKLRGGVIDPQGDHRIAMTGAVAALVTDGPIELEQADCADVSYPDFYATLGGLHA